MSKSTQDVRVTDKDGNLVYEMKGGNMTIASGNVTLSDGKIIVTPNSGTKAHEDIDVLGDFIDY